MLPDVTTYTHIGSVRQVFPSITDPATGRTLVLDAGATVDLTDDPDTPWLVTDPNTAESVATSSGTATKAKRTRKAKPDPDAPASDA